MQAFCQPLCSRDPTDDLEQARTRTARFRNVCGRQSSVAHWTSHSRRNACNSRGAVTVPLNEIPKPVVVALPRGSRGRQGDNDRAIRRGRSTLKRTWRHVRGDGPSAVATTHRERAECPGGTALTPVTLSLAFLVSVLSCLTRKSLPFQHRRILAVADGSGSSAPQARSSSCCSSSQSSPRCRSRQ